MGGSKSQTVGYTYFKGFMAVIGNRIEQLLDINPDKKGWIMEANQKEILKDGQATVHVNLPSLFGGDKKEGGWVGDIDVYVGRDEQPQNAYLANQIDEDVSAYPNLSYLVFRGQDSLDKGFQLVSMSGMMKEFMIWVKRTRIKNDGSKQWYELNEDGEIVCEIEATYGGAAVQPTPLNEIYGSVTCNYYNTPSGTRSSSQHKTFNDVILKNDVWGKLNELEYSNIDFVSLNNDVPYTVGFNFQIPEGKGGFVFVVDARMASVGIRELKPELFSAGTLEPEIKIEKVFLENTKTFRWFITVNTRPRDFNFFVKCNLYPDDDGTYFFNYRVELVGIYQIPINPSYENLAFDINPIHKIREILTDYTAMGKPESDINDENFRFMADRIYDEGLGVSWCIQQKSCKEALEELEYHIEGGVRINRQTGLYEVILFRDDLLNLGNALHFDESNIKSFQPDIVNAEDQINAVNVSFYDRENIKDSSFSLSDIGSFHTIDHENAEDLKFPYFMNRRNAEMVANWKLKQLSTMAWKGTITTGKYEARKLNKYDVVLLSWKSKNIVNLPVRVMNINLGNGRDNTVTLDFVEVVPYSNISYSSINVDPNPNPILPPLPNSSIVFEMPYFEAVQRMGQTSVDTELANNPEIGYLMAATIKPQNNSLSALLYSDSGSDSSSFEEVGVVDYCAGCILDQDISFVDTSFAVKNVQDLSRVKFGTLVQIDQELLVYQNYDIETKVLTVKRGALDTLPRPHSKDAVFYFWDDSSGLDQTVYIDGETVHAKVLTTTPSGVENLGTSTVRSLNIKGRANRPYPPANVKINDEYWPVEIENDLVLTWVDRNRMQQTGGDIIGWYEGGVIIEPGTSTYLVLNEYDQNHIEVATNNVNVTGLSNYAVPNATLHRDTRTIEIVLKTIRDGHECLQYFVHTVELSQFFAAPYNLYVEYSE